MIDVKIINNADKVNFISSSNLEGKIYLKNNVGFKELLSSFSFIGTYEYTPTTDGLYTFEFSNADPICKTVVFDYYRNFELRDSFLDSVDEVVCEQGNCGCEGCDECNEEIISLVKALSYYYLQNPLLSLYQQAAFTCLSTLLTNINSCILLNEKILGSSENKELLKIILAYHYYVIYKYELDNNLDSEWVKTNYRESTTLQCVLNETELDTDCIDASLDLFLKHTTLNTLKEDIILESEEERYIEKGLNPIYEKYEGKKICKKHFNLLKNKFPEKVEKFSEIKFLDKLFGVKCPICKEEGEKDNER